MRIEHLPVLIILFVSFDGGSIPAFPQSWESDRHAYVPAAMPESHHVYGELDTVVCRPLRDVWSSSYILWCRFYNHRKNRDDEVTGLALSPGGDVWVTGRVQNIISGYDFRTILYDTDGNVLSEKRYNGSGYGDDIPSGAVVDRDSNCYVAGRTWGGSMQENFVLVKYDQEGTEVWNEIYDGPESGTDYPADIAVDSLLNVAVVGTSYFGSGRGLDICVVKYDGDGNLLWAEYLAGGGNWTDRGVSITSDSECNLIVTGNTFDGIQTEFNITTCKYDSSGVQVWSRSYDGGASEGDYAVESTVDALDNVIVCGYTRNEDSNRDFVILKYDSSPEGNLLWEQRFDGFAQRDDYPADMVVDGDGAVYLTGWCRDSDGTSDAATIKLDSDGNLLWSARFYGFWGTTEKGYRLTLGEAGNVYVAATSFDPYEGDTDIFVLTYDQNGTLLRMRQYDGAGQGRDEPAGLLYDGMEGLYLGGSTFGGVSDESDMDYLLMKFTP